jgi:type I restriction enzyme S subunit
MHAHHTGLQCGQPPGTLNQVPEEGATKGEAGAYILPRLGNAVFGLRTRRDDFLPEYLAALIGSPAGKAYFQEASKQTTNLASINQRQLRAIRVIQPPISVQSHIVAELDALQTEVNSIKCLQTETTTALDALLPAILDQAFQGEL